MSYNVMVVPLIIGALGGGMRQIAKDLGVIFENNDVKQKTICEMQKTILMDSETMVRKVLSGLIQDMDEQNDLMVHSVNLFFNCN